MRPNSRSGAAFVSAAVLAYSGAMLARERPPTRIDGYMANPPPYDGFSGRGHMAGRSPWKTARREAIARRSARPGRTGWKGEAKARKAAAARRGA